MKLKRSALMDPIETKLSSEDVEWDEPPRGYPESHHQSGIAPSQECCNT